MKFEPMKDQTTDDELRSVDLNLPSRCIDYASQMQGPFSIRPPRVSEVEILAGMSAQSYDVQLTKILRALVVKPQLIDPDNLTLGDRQYLHVWVRAQIDPTYVFETKCPICKEVIPNYRLEISKIPLRNVPDEYKPGMQLTLPKSKQKVSVRLETARDRTRAKELEEAGIPQWTARKALVIVAVEGVQMADEARCAWLRGLPAGDDLFMGQYLIWQRHGPMFSECPFSCPKCKKAATINMPFRLEFFMPTVQAASAFGDAIRGSGDGADGGVSGDARDRGDGVREVHLGKG